MYPYSPMYNPMMAAMQMSAAYWQGVFEMQRSMLQLWGIDVGTWTPGMDAPGDTAKPGITSTGKRGKTSANEFAGRADDPETPQPV